MKKMKQDRKVINQAGVVRASSVGWLIHMLARQMDNAMVDALKPLGVTIDQFKVVMTLMEVEGVSQVEIGKRVDLPSYSMTRLLDSMEESGLLERHPDATSRRAFSIHLTSKGKSLGPKLIQTVSDVNQQVLNPLSATENRQLTKILQKLAPDWSIQS